MFEKPTVLNGKMGLKTCYMENSFLILLLATTCLASPSPIRPRPSIRMKLDGGDAIGNATTSPTISVQRFGGSTFYNYLKSEPTEASITSTSPSTDVESLTESSSQIAEVSASTTGSSDNSSSSDDDDEESSEDVIVSKAREDDAEIPGTTPGPAGDVGEDGRTDAPAPVSSADSSDGGVGSNDGGEAVVVPGADSSDGGNGNDGNVPSDQTPPPAEAVPGQPGEDDPDSSSSSSSSEESSSSSEEFKQAYKKVWEHNKVKSKDALLLARLQSKLAKKEKANKYSYY